MAAVSKGRPDHPGPEEAAGTGGRPRTQPTVSGGRRQRHRWKMALREGVKRRTTRTTLRPLASRDSRASAQGFPEGAGPARHCNVAKHRTRSVAPPRRQAIRQHRGLDRQHDLRAGMPKRDHGRPGAALRLFAERVSPGFHNLADLELELTISRQPGSPGKSV